MKMTMHIDEALLKEVMAATGATTKTAAVDAALRKIATKFRQREAWKVGLGMTPEEIRASFDPNVSLAMNGEVNLMMLAEDPPAPRPVRYGRKRPG
jgi:Arc/MetJ family transcription regulator